MHIKLSQKVDNYIKSQQFRTKAKIFATKVYLFPPYYDKVYKVTTMKPKT